MEPKKDKNLDLIIRDNVFYGNNLLYFIYKRSLKVSKAIYLVTDIIKDVEPLKWSLRSAAANLAVIKDNEDVKKAGQSMGVKIGNIRTLVLLSNFSKNISEMNTQVLVKECDDVQLLIDELDGFSNYLSLSSDFFNTTEGVSPSPFLKTLEKEKQESKEENDSKGHIKDKNENMSFKTNMSYKPLQSKAAAFIKDENKSNRSEKILDIIKNKGEVSIKDISVLFTDCSEKTIQRELNDLLAVGKIKKTGDRRWSKYLLK